MTDQPTTEELLNTDDARVWARAFKATIEAQPHLSTDEGFLIGWFANAIETAKAVAVSDD